MAVICFRADASIEIGTGHVMRCLALANELEIRGINCVFICRAHPGNLIELIRGKGYTVYALDVKPTAWGGGSSAESSYGRMAIGSVQLKPKM